MRSTLPPKYIQIRQIYPEPSGQEFQVSSVLPNTFQSPVGYKNVSDQNNNILMLLDSCTNRIAVLLEISSGHQMLFQPLSLLLFLVVALYINLAQSILATTFCSKTLHLMQPKQLYFNNAVIKRKAFFS